MDPRRRQNSQQFEINFYIQRDNILNCLNKLHVDYCYTGFNGIGGRGSRSLPDPDTEPLTLESSGEIEMDSSIVNCCYVIFYAVCVL
jgi:hypothetical protein